VLAGRRSLVVLLPRSGSGINLDHSALAFASLPEGSSTCARATPHLNDVVDERGSGIHDYPWYAALVCQARWDVMPLATVSELCCACACAQVQPDIDE
jgi:hypothetical protein